MKFSRLLASIIIAVTSTTSYAGNNLRIIVGTYTDDGSHGIYSYSFNQNTGESSVLDSLAMVNPSFLEISKDKQFIYAVSEVGSKEASANSISFDKQNGKMKLLNSVQTNGADPCFIETNGKLLLTANYTGGSMSVFTINTDGTIGKLSNVFNGNTGGKYPQQSSAHVHAARFMKDGNILATDFSADRLIRFRVNETTVNEEGVAGFTMPNSGPRHIEFSKKDKYVYVINELAGTVTVFSNNNGELERIQTIESDSVGGRGCADIHLSKDGKFLYASNRLKDDGISIFKVDKKTGKLTKIGYKHTGIHPRNFIITPNGRFLLAACRNSNIIQIFRINKKTGLLTNTHNSIVLSKPVCIKFVE